MALSLFVLLLTSCFAETDERRDLLSTILNKEHREEGIDKPPGARFTNPDGQTCTFAAKGFIGLGHAEGIMCGFNGGDKEYQLLLPEDLKVELCVDECRKRQWCNYAFSPPTGWGWRFSKCYLFATCNDQTTNAGETGRLYEKKCPKTPLRELPESQYTTSKKGVVCSSSSYLKGFATKSEGSCEKECDSRGACDAYCWSDKTRDWDCLLCKDYSSTVSRFSYGNSAATYTCRKKPGSAAQDALAMADVTPESGNWVSSWDLQTVGTYVFAGVGVASLIGLSLRAMKGRAYEAIPEQLP